MEKMYFERFETGFIRIDKKCYEIVLQSPDGILNCFLLNLKGNRESSAVIDLDEVQLHQITSIGKQPGWDLGA